jgi:hypothetical protein
MALHWLDENKNQGWKWDTTNSALKLYHSTSLCMTVTPSTGAVVFAGAVSGITTLASTGNATVGGTLGVTGASTLASVAVTGAATVGTTLGVTGNTTVGGTLGVTGASTLASVGVTGAATVGTTLGVTGNTTVGGTLGVTGATSLAAVSTTGATTTTSGVGAIGADGSLTSERGISGVHLTKLTFAKSATVAAAALSWGGECYTMPAVRTVILGLSIDGYMQSTGAGGAVGDVGEVGVGVLVGSGAAATLAAVGANAENIITGTAHTAVAADTSGVADVATAVGLGAGLVLAASAVIYANAAGTWSGADDVAFAGTMHVCWAELD